MMKNKETNENNNENMNEEKIGIKLPNWLGYPIFILIILMPIFVIIGLRTISIETSAEVQNIDVEMMIECDETYIGVGEELKIKCKNLTDTSVLQSSNPDVIEIIDNSTIIGKSEGEAIIYAIDGEKRSNEVLLKCVVKIEEIILDETNIEIKMGEEKTLVITLVPENATNKNLVWSSSDESIATCEDRKNKRYK